MSDIIFEEVDGEVVIAEMMMLRAESDVAILVVEGASDMKLMSAFVDEDVCSIIISEGKENAISAMKIARSEGIVGAVALVDRDSDDFLGVDHREGGEIIVTDERDIEQILIKSEAFNRLLIEFGSKRKVQIVKNKVNDLREILLDAVYPMAIIRLFSTMNNLNIKFSNIDYNFIDRKTMICNNEKMVKEICNKSKCQKMSDVLLGHLKSDHGNLDKWHLCCGHDLTMALAKAFQSFIGSKTHLVSTQEEIESRLRLAFSRDDFKVSSIFRDLKTWEKGAAPYRCLRLEI